MTSRGADRTTIAQLRFEAAVAVYRCAGELRRIAQQMPAEAGHVASASRLLRGLAQSLADGTSPTADLRKR